MHRLYYIADDLPTTGAVARALHEEGVTDWNFHVIARDATGFYRHHIHSASALHQLDIIHTGERWALGGLGFGLLLGLLVGLLSELGGWPVAGGSGLGTAALIAVAGGLSGACLGGMAGRVRENYKLEPYHEDIEDGRILIMVDVKPGSRARVGEIMNMGFPRIRYCGKDSTLINPLRRASRVYQSTH